MAGKSKKNDSQKENIVNFLEEFSWLLKNYSDNNSNNNIIEGLEGFIKYNKTTIKFDEFVPVNPNIAFLVGALPGLFMNKNHFPKNEDIVNFAEKVLKIVVTRSDKRSQYELIGLIVCEVSNLDDKKLEAVVSELKQYLPTKDKNSTIKLEWNEVIRKLSGE